MIKKHVHRGLTWIDLESPSQDEIRTVAKEYDLNSLVVHELSAPTLRSKVDLYQHFIYLILHFPRLRRNKQEEQDQEIDFILGKKFLITVRHGASETFYHVSKMFETNTTLDKNTFGPHAGFLFFFLVGKIYESLIHEVSAAHGSLRSIEERIFSGEEREMVISLSKVSRDLLYFRRSLSRHREVLESFELAGKKLLGVAFIFHLRTLIGDYYRVNQAVESNVAFLNELRETNNALLTTKQNEVMKTLTVLAFIALPATTVLSLFQIDSRARPIIGMPFDFWILLGLVACIAFGLYHLVQTQEMAVISLLVH